MVKFTLVYEERTVSAYSYFGVIGFDDPFKTDYDLIMEDLKKKYYENNHLILIDMDIDDWFHIRVFKAECDKT